MQSIHAFFHSFIYLFIDSEMQIFKRKCCTSIQTADAIVTAAPPNQSVTTNPFG